MIGAAEPEESPASRGKYRFASEVSNLRKEHLAARRKTAPQGASELMSGMVAQTRSNAPSPFHSAPTTPGSYPSTGTADIAVATVPGHAPLTQRLPDVRQASYGDQQTF
jgi:hypothetical protein